MDMEIIDGKKNPFGRFWARHAPVVSYCNPSDPPWRQLMIRTVELVSGQPRLQRIYDRYTRDREIKPDFWEAAIERLDLTVRHGTDRLGQIPVSGPLVVVANHPFGVLDGIALGYLISRVRSDFKILAHATFERADVLKPWLIPISFDESPAAIRANIDSKKAAQTHLKSGGTVVIFPAGGVSTAANVFGRATDLPWKTFVGKLITGTGATVVPVFFEGQNGWLFHLVSQFSAPLREALLMREVSKRIGSDINAHIGSPIPDADLNRINDRQALIDHLREQVYRLDPTRQFAAA